MNNPCPCGSNQPYGDCCEKLLNGAKASTAEQLMRSRYVAYTQANLDYIERTHDPATRSELDINTARQWAENSQWLGLEILHTEAGQADDDTGLVEFKAHYRLKGERQHHHELSEFVKHAGEWFYHDGKTPAINTVRRAVPKVGRNDPCPCGSGKKYKKCCAV